MQLARTLFVPLAALTSVFALASCGESTAGSGGGFSGVFTSVDSDEIAFEFKHDGTVVARMAGEQGQPGTFTLDGEKILVDFDGQRTTLGDALR